MLLLLLLLYTFLFNDQRHQTKRKTKRKKKGVRIKAILGRIRTRDPDPGYFGLDFDSGSGLGSAITDPGPGAALKHGLFGLFTDFLRTFRTFRTQFLPGRYAKVCMCVSGETASVKSGLKQEKLSVRPRYFLDCAQVFTRVEGGGSEAPIRRMARWGLQVNRHGTSFIKINFNPRVCFAITFSHSFVRAVHT